MHFHNRWYADANKDAIFVTFKGEGQLDFVPGQYVRVQLVKELFTDEHGDARFFNIASYPREKKEGKITIVTRLRQSAFKRNLAALEMGTPVMVSEPFGDFRLTDNLGIPHIMLVGGTGIAPVLAMLFNKLEGSDKHRLKLVYSNKTIGRTVEHELLMRSRAMYLEGYFNTLTDMELVPYGYFKGRINPSMLTGVLTPEDLTVAHFYVSGPPGMGDDMQKVLEKLNISRERIHIKEYDLALLGSSDAR